MQTWNYGHRTNTLKILKNKTKQNKKTAHEYNYLLTTQLKLTFFTVYPANSSKGFSCNLSGRAMSERYFLANTRGRAEASFGSRTPKKPIWTPYFRNLYQLGGPYQSLLITSATLVGTSLFLLGPPTFPFSITPGGSIGTPELFYSALPLANTNGNSQHSSWWLRLKGINNALRWPHDFGGKFMKQWSRTIGLVLHAYARTTEIVSQYLLILSGLHSLQTKWMVYAQQKHMTETSYPNHHITVQYKIVFFFFFYTATTAR